MSQKRRIKQLQAELAQLKRKQRQARTSREFYDIERKIQDTVALIQTLQS